MVQAKQNLQSAKETLGLKDKTSTNFDDEELKNLSEQRLNLKQKHCLKMKTKK